MYTTLVILLKNRGYEEHDRESDRSESGQTDKVVNGHKGERCGSGVIQCELV